MGEKVGGRGWVNLEISLSNAPYLLFVDIPAICYQVLALTPVLRFKYQQILN